MPAAYAHYQFGCECIETLPEDIKKACLAHRDVFDLGVHGPDIFFYYHPLKSNHVTKFGSELHHHSGREFFTHCAAVYREMKPGEKKDAMTSYLFGFLAHFALDSSCHGYINRLPRTKGISHNYAESQYEAYCMKKDGKNPVKVNRQQILAPSRSAAATIGKFYDFSEEEVFNSIEGQRRTMGLFYSPTGIKKTILRGLIKLLRIGGDFGDLFIDGKVDPRCEETNRAIAGMQADALQIYPALAKNLTAFLGGKEELSDYFEHDFEGN